MPALAITRRRGPNLAAIALDGFKSPSFHRCQYSTDSKQAHAWLAGRILAAHGLTMTERSPVHWLRLGTVTIGPHLVSTLANMVTMHERP